MRAWDHDLAQTLRMRQRTVAAIFLAFVLGLAISLAWSLVGFGGYGF
jgi:hypothetical protein